MNNPDSPSPISSQNSTSGDENSLSNRQQQQQQQQKKKGIRNSLGRLFTRKNDFNEQKSSSEITPISRGKTLRIQLICYLLVFR